MPFKRVCSNLSTYVLNDVCTYRNRCSKASFPIDTSFLDAYVWGGNPAKFIRK